MRFIKNALHALYVAGQRNDNGVFIIITPQRGGGVIVAGPKRVGIQ